MVVGGVFHSCSMYGGLCKGEEALTVVRVCVLLVFVAFVTSWVVWLVDVQGRDGGEASSCRMESLVSSMSSASSPLALMPRLDYTDT